MSLSLCLSLLQICSTYQLCDWHALALSVAHSNITGEGCVVCVMTMNQIITHILCRAVVMTKRRLHEW